MKIRYRTTKIKKLLTETKKLKKKYNDQVIRKIAQRMSELDAAETLDDLPPAARVHPREPKKYGMFQVDIMKHRHCLRLLFSADGDYDLSDRRTIKAVIIEKIIKTHS
jgi:proteic killer suppression protein